MGAATADWRQSPATSDECLQLVLLHLSFSLDCLVPDQADVVPFARAMFDILPLPVLPKPIMPSLSSCFVRPTHVRLLSYPPFIITSDGEEDELSETEASPHRRTDKRRRTKRNGVSPSKRSYHDSPVSPAEPPTSSYSRNGARPAHLAPIKPVGFAAGRESRRGGDDEPMLPSPVVMGFDFKRVDEDQLKTVSRTLRRGLPF